MDKLKEYGAAPSLFAKSLSATEISLYWTHVSGAAAYELYRSDSENGFYELCAKTPDNFCDINELSPDSVYYFRVRAITSNGAGMLSSAVSTATHSQCIAPPDSLSARALSGGEIELSWSSDARAFAVYRSISKDGNYTFAGSTTRLKFCDKGLMPDTTYYYKVSAYEGASSSEFAGPVLVTTDKE